MARRLIVLVTALLCACTLEPHYHRPPPPVPPVAAGAPGGAAAAQIGWRQLFPDPQLRRLIELALKSNRDLRVAALNVQSAQEQYRVQRSQLFPTIAATGQEEVESFPKGVFNPGAGGGTAVLGGSIFRFFDVGIGFTNYELDVFGRLRSLTHAALEQYFSGQETRRSTELSLVAEVAGAYLSVLADQTLIDITRETLTSQSESYDLTKQQFSTGTTNELALRQAETTVDTARASLAQYIRQLVQDRNALQLLLGAPIPADIESSGGLDRGEVVAELEEGIPSDVLLLRPDVLAAEHQLRAANAQIGAARAAFFPAVTLTGSYGTASAQLSGLFKSGSDAWIFSPQITVPIFTGGANVANLRAAKVARETAVAQYEKAIQTAFREVADALVARSTLNDQLQAQQDLVNAAGKAYKIADMRFRGGVDSYLPALVEHRTLYVAQQDLALVRLLRLQNLVTLYKVLGGGLLEDGLAPGAPAPPSSARPAPPPASPP